MSAARSSVRPVLSAGIIPIAVDEGGKKYLVLRAYNYWDFPKGIIEPEEDSLAGALRELREETALDTVDFPWGEAFRETPPYSHRKIARYYVGRVHAQAASRPLRLSREHHEFRWAPYAEARKLVSDRVKPILDWADRISG